MIRSSLRTYLASQSNITDIVGQRIYGIVLPQSADFPAITFARLTGGHDHNIRGSAGRAMPSFQIDCWALTYEQADQLAEAVRLKMQGFSGTMGSDTVTAVVLDDETDHFEPPQDASDDGIYHITLRYRIQYSEAIPAL